MTGTPVTDPQEPAGAPGRPRARARSRPLNMQVAALGGGTGPVESVPGAGGGGALRPRSQLGQASMVHGFNFPSQRWHPGAVQTPHLSLMNL